MAAFESFQQHVPGYGTMFMQNIYTNTATYARPTQIISWRREYVQYYTASNWEHQPTDEERAKAEKAFRYAVIGQSRRLAKSDPIVTIPKPQTPVLIAVQPWFVHRQRCAHRRGIAIRKVLATYGNRVTL